jgi:hypothetical protein
MSLQTDFAFYLAHQAEFLQKYAGRVLAIRDGVLLGDYADELSAVAETTKHYPLGTFLIQRCEPGATSQTFHSRVAFA